MSGPDLPDGPAAFGATRRPYQPPTKAGQSDEIVAHSPGAIFHIDHQSILKARARFTLLQDNASGAAPAPALARYSREVSMAPMNKSPARPVLLPQPERTAPRYRTAEPFTSSTVSEIANHLAPKKATTTADAVDTIGQQEETSPSPRTPVAPRPSVSKILSQLESKAPQLAPPARHSSVRDLARKMDVRTPAKARSSMFSAKTEKSPAADNMEVPTMSPITPASFEERKKLFSVAASAPKRDSSVRDLARLMDSKSASRSFKTASKKPVAAASKPIEKKPVEKKPAEKKPAEKKPAEKKQEEPSLIVESVADRTKMFSSRTNEPFVVPSVSDASEKTSAAQQNVSSILSNFEEIPSISPTKKPVVTSQAEASSMLLQFEAAPVSAPINEKPVVKQQGLSNILSDFEPTSIATLDAASKRRGLPALPPTPPPPPPAPPAEQPARSLLSLAGVRDQRTSLQDSAPGFQAVDEFADELLIAREEAAIDQFPEFEARETYHHDRAADPFEDAAHVDPSASVSRSMSDSFLEQQPQHQVQTQDHEQWRHEYVGYDRPMIGFDEDDTLQLPSEMSEENYTTSTRTRRRKKKDVLPEVPTCEREASAEYFMPEEFPTELSVVSREETPPLVDMFNYPVIKHGRNGRPKRVHLTIEAETGLIRWGEGKRFLRIENIKQIRSGKQTRVFQRRPAKPVDANLCLSLVTERRTLDIQLKTRDERQVVMSSIMNSIIDYLKMNNVKAAWTRPGDDVPYALTA